MPSFLETSQAEIPSQPSIQTLAGDDYRTERDSPGAANPPPSNHSEDLRSEPSPILQTDLVKSGSKHDSSTAVSRLEANLSKLSEVLKDGPGSLQECIVSTILLYPSTLLWDVLAPERPLEPMRLKGVISDYLPH